MIVKGKPDPGVPDAELFVPFDRLSATHGATHEAVRLGAVINRTGLVEVQGHPVGGGRRLGAPGGMNVAAKGV